MFVSVKSKEELARSYGEGGKKKESKGPTDESKTDSKPEALLTLASLEAKLQRAKERQD